MDIIDLNQNTALKNIVDRLVKAFAPEVIYLFGSTARGDKGPDSDYDIMVIVSESDKPKYQLARHAQRALWGLPNGADVLVLTRKEFDEARTVICSLPSTVLREGKELYAA